MNDGSHHRTRPKDMIRLADLMEEWAIPDCPFFLNCQRSGRCHYGQYPGKLTESEGIWLVLRDVWRNSLRPIVRIDSRGVRYTRFLH